MPQTFNVGNRSWFVNVTAWVAMLLAGFVGLCALLQRADWLSLLPGLGAGAPLPALTGWLVATLPWWIAGAALLAVATLAAAIGLLLRLEWARRVFIGLVVLAIVANLLGLWFQHELVSTLVDATLRQAPVPARVVGVFGGFATAAQVLGVAMTLLVCALLGGVIRRLNSSAVRQEFA